MTASPPAPPRRLDGEIAGVLMAAAARRPVLTVLPGPAAWRYRLRNDGVELLLGPAATDPHSTRLAVIATGAALANLRLAVGHLGYLPDVELVGDVQDRGLLARVMLGDPTGPRPDEERLYAAAAARPDHPTDFGAEAPNEEDLEALVLAGLSAGLDVVVPDGSSAIAVDAALTTAPEDEDGEDVQGFWLPPSTERTVRALVLVTGSDDPTTWLATGQGLQHILLEAACRSLAVRVAAPAETGPYGRATLAQLLCPGRHVQVAIQVGTAVG